ncbi:hypothetical protein Hte_007468 [Hypoxylon texense]
MASTQLVRECVRALEGLIYDARHTCNAQIDRVDFCLHNAMDALLEDEGYEAHLSLYDRGPLSRPHVAWLVMNQAWKLMMNNVEITFTKMACPAADEGPDCFNPVDILEELKDMTMEHTTHPCGLTGVFAFWIFTGSVWADSDVQGIQLSYHFPQPVAQRTHSAPGLVSTRGVTFLTAYNEWRRAQNAIEEDLTSANFLRLWHAAEHALFLANRHPGMPTPPPLLGRLLSWVGVRLDDPEPHRQTEQALISNPAPSMGPPFVDHDDMEVTAQDMIEATEAWTDSIMWDCLGRQEERLFGAIYNGDDELDFSGRLSD